VEWQTASGGNRVDVVTSASATSYSPRVNIWDMTDINHQPVAAGNYVLRIEVTDHMGPGAVSEIPIQKISDAVDATLPDQPFLANVSLDYP